MSRAQPLAARLATDLRWALDPAAFAREALGITPDPWQERVLRWRGQRLILCVTRQGGKSSTTATLAGHTALYEPGSLTLLVSPSQRQSSELFRKVREPLSRLEEAGILPEPDEDNKLSLQLPNGSRIVSLPSSQATIRGFSAVRLAIFDEDAWVPDELYAAVRPMLAVSHGRLILMSTPFGRRGHFWETWDKGGPEWERVKVTAHDCPRITPEFLDEERRTLGDLRFQSEYMCEFADVLSAVFPSELIEQAFSDDVAPLFGDAGDATADAPGDTADGIAPLFE